MITPMKLILLSVSALLFTSLLSAGSPPNLLVIMCDDLGYSDVGFNGGEEIPTPNIDTIASQGIVFTNGCASYSVCVPSRAGFITGRYQERFGFGRNPQYRPDDPNMGLPADEQTIAEALRTVGYTSGIIGKWHLGANREAHHPLNRGFDEFFGHLGGGHHYFPDLLTIRDSYAVQSEVDSYKTWIMRDHEPVDEVDAYLTDAFSEEALRFLERHQEDPFFLFLSYNAPHTPMQATEEDLASFAHIPDLNRRRYAAMVSAVDDGVGQILEKLRELGLEENTIIFFFSDNGGPMNANASENQPLRGQKSDVWEGGFRVPYAMQWPAVLEGGQTFPEPVSLMDVFGTIAAVADVDRSDQKPLDGVNLIPYLTGEKEGAPHERIFIRRFDAKRSAVRSGDYKLLVQPDEGKWHARHRGAQGRL
jgi:arylsulfatase A-like enzyme